MSADIFTVNVPYSIQSGWGVDFYVIYGSEEDDEQDDIIEVIPNVVRIAPETVKVIGSAPCVFVSGDSWVPVSNFLPSVSDSYDDTHDLRARWFASEDEARAHEAYTMRRWLNPQPWVAFVSV